MFLVQLIKLFYDCEAFCVLVMIRISFYHFFRAIFGL